MKPAISNSTLDGIAVFLSATCLVHCLALPLMLTLPAIGLGSFLDHETFHLVMLVFVLPVSIVALTIGCRRHRKMVILVLGGVGLSLLTVTALIGHDVFGHTGERVVTSIAGIILAIAHILNFRECRRLDCHHDHDSEELSHS